MPDRRGKLPRARHPRVPLHQLFPLLVHAVLFGAGYGRQAGMVRAGTADLALLCPPLEPDGLDTEVLASEPRVLAVPVGHELAERDEVRCDDLDGQVAGGFAGRSDTSLTNPCALANPCVAGIDQLLQIEISKHPLGQMAARTGDP